MGEWNREWRKNLIAQNTFYDVLLWEFSPIFVMFKLYDAVIPRSCVFSLFRRSLIDFFFITICSDSKLLVLSGVSQLDF